MNRKQHIENLKGTIVYNANVKHIHSLKYAIDHLSREWVSGKTHRKLKKQYSILQKMHVDIVVKNTHLHVDIEKYSHIYKESCDMNSELRIKNSHLEKEEKELKDALILTKMHLQKNKDGILNLQKANMKLDGMIGELTKENQLLASASQKVSNINEKLEAENKAMAQTIDEIRMHNVKIKSQNKEIIIAGFIFVIFSLLLEILLYANR